MITTLHVCSALLILAISLDDADSHRISRWRPSWLWRACPRNYCSNGGVCRRQRGSMSCECSGGFSGSRCECTSTEPDECATNNPCQFNSLCLNNIGGPGVTCTCPQGYSGVNCETNIDDCTATSCENNGTCVDGIDSFYCVCPENFKGRFCEVAPDVDECVTANPCQFNSLCLNNVDGPGVTCTCPQGYSGVNCEINIGNCLPTTCKNGGTCVDGIDSFSCTCRENFKGKLCELDCRGTFRLVEGREAVIPSQEVPLPQDTCVPASCSSPCKAIAYFTENATCRTYNSPVLNVDSIVGESTAQVISDCVLFCIITDQCKFANVIIDNDGNQICVLFDTDILNVGAFDNQNASLIQRIEGCFLNP